jgi:hypothetical protein
MTGITLTEAWSSTYLMGLFDAAIARGDLPDRKLENYYWSRVGETLQATLRDTKTNRVELWEIDLRTGRPRLSRQCGMEILHERTG